MHCWHENYDAVIVDRATLAHIHELAKFTEVHLGWLQQDIQAYFQFSIKLYYAEPHKKFAAVALSRVEFPPTFGTTTMRDEPRAQHWRSKKFRVCALSELTTCKTTFTEKDAATFLCQASVGLAVPTSRPVVIPRKIVRLRPPFPPRA